jgi:hypothetical protein
MKLIAHYGSIACIAIGLPTCAVAQTAPPSDFTTAAGAAFIHQSIKDQILSFGDDGDTDTIYFTAILSWRCGVQGLYYGLNDAPADTQFPLEPCYRELRQPNTNKELGTNFPLSITVPKGSVQQVTLRIVYEDGSTASFTSERAKNLVY